MIKFKYSFSIFYIIWMFVIVSEIWVFTFLGHIMIPPKGTIFTVWWGFPYIITVAMVGVITTVIFYKITEYYEKI